MTSRTAIPPRALSVILFITLIVSSCRYDSQPERLRRFAQASTSAPVNEQRASEQISAKPSTPPLTAKEQLAADAIDTIPLATHRAVIRTSEGAFTLHLYGKDAPKTVENFIKLAERKFYRGILIHRIAKDFVVQMGDPKTKDKRKRDEWGSGGESASGEGFETEVNSDAPSVKRGYRRGVVAMANRGGETNTSQFFICLRDIPNLPLRSSIFGDVASGMATLDSIAAQAITPVLSSTDGRPQKPITILSVSVSAIVPVP